MNEILASYIEDLRDSILLFNESLISVQNGNRGNDIVNNIFRVAHTIKGNSAAMNFMKIQKVMHTMEDLLSEVRNGTRELTDELVTVLFSCHDFLEDCLEVVQNNASDEEMETEKLLGRLVDLKNNKVGGSQSAHAPTVPFTAPAAVQTPPAAHQPVPTAAVSTDDIDLGINMPGDLWELLQENIKNGYSSYKLQINFMKNSAMRAVRAWMLFDRIDQSGILIYSDPPRLNENNFNATGETPFTSDTIEALILSEHEISELISDIRNTPDIESAEVAKLQNNDIVKKCEYIKKQRALIEQIQEIGVELLGVELSYIKDETVKNIIGKMNLITKSNILPDSNPVFIVAKRLGASLEEALKVKKRIPIEERENIIFLCQTIEECMTNPDLQKDKNFIAVMYRKLDDVLDIITAPEKLIGDILTSSGAIKNTDVKEILDRQKDAGNESLKFGQVAVKEKLVSALDVMNALSDKPDKEKTEKAAVTPAKGTQAQDSGFVRVPVAKVDSLIDMLSELLIYNSQLEQSTALLEMDDSKTANILSRTEKLIKEIQALSMSLRMIEVKQTFHRLTRIARDTATDLGKKITVNLEGEDTEIDRSAVEKLFDPLMHMVRNAVSHGIEDSEEDRISIGKKPDGQVTISGYSKRGNVYVDVKDDGRGINTKKVFEKAKKQGLINESKEYTEQEIFKFIFLPGFSTQENVNTISGRGVGMNVVEEVVTKLGGKIEVDSVLGAGSSFRIKLPINLAVVNGTIVEIAGNRYIIPTMCVKKFFIAKDKDWVSLQGENRAIKLDDGSIISIVSKEKVFGIPDDILNRKFDKRTSDEEVKEYEMVLLEIDQKLLCLHVDKIIGRQDVVSKPLSTYYASVPYANSASILGDGIVSLILDIDAIFKISQPM